MKHSPFLTATPRGLVPAVLSKSPAPQKTDEILAGSANTYLGKYLWEVFWSVSDKWKESRDIGEHTGQDERIFCFKIKDKLQQIYAIIHWDFLQR